MPGGSRRPLERVLVALAVTITLLSVALSP